ncbi:MAG: hypothetical protein ACE5HX_04320 [bacterium]
MKIKFLLVLLLAPAFLAGCQENSKKQIGEKPSQAMKYDKPQIRKIPIQNKAQVDSLLRLGIDIIVVEDSYVAARIMPDDSSKIKTASLKTEPIQEQELIQRLVRIPIKEKSQVSELANLGMDIWEAKEDTVVAQVFDNQIRDAEAKGFTVVIVARNVLDTVKKKSKE